MAKFDKLAVMQKIGETGMVPVFYHSNAETAKKVIKACYDGGVRAFEFTNRGDFAQEVFAECVKFAAKECPELALGIGSVVDAPTAALYIQLGACFVVGPLFNPGMHPPFGALLSGMRHRIGNRQGAGIRLRPLQALPRRRVRPGFRKRNDGPLPVDQTHGDGRRGTYERKPDRMGQGRSLLCGNGLQAVPERRSSSRKLAIHYRQM